ncbi:hypothetical protein HC028_26205 [Planosporangium flavigriseum]|uniref:Ferredoxin n=1 Tax=Planosporangium flavigriseum TaxID=373681 RepID=A0A8J3LNZ9_9ACTN|nr:ferredoxin [Planosporangium flavigriseum]NJC67972.1 hypothetical protein [Planosporangium flavigriseum]GIG76628.1 hypothetical protein Pfl04_50320 [Planosporangium flavigriseum]
MFTDPIIPLTIVTVLAWSAIIVWKLQRRQPAYGVNRTAQRGPAPWARRFRAAPQWEDDSWEWDEDARGRDFRDEDLRDEVPPGRGGRRPYDERPAYDDRPRRPFPGVERADHAEVEINPGKCMRFAFCEQEAPEVFKLVGDRIDYKPSVPAEHVASADMAAKICPARAIKIKMPGTKPYLPQPPVDDDERRPVRR